MEDQDERATASAQGPEELWLQLHGDCHESELSEPVDYTSGDVTWCWHKINDSDVRYVRADRAALAQPSAEPVHIRSRWNIEEDGDDLLVCFNLHDKGEKCEYVRYVRASAPPSAAVPAAMQQWREEAERLIDRMCIDYSRATREFLKQESVNEYNRLKDASDASRAALLAHLYAVPSAPQGANGVLASGGWRPISTAPKDGSRILLRWKHRPARVGWWTDEESGTGWKCDGDVVVPCAAAQADATRWQPVPADDVSVCRKCGGTMKPSKAIPQAFSTGQEGTVSETAHVGAVSLIDCMKCERCGWSVTSGVQACDPWHPIETAPQNQRVLIEGDNESAMAWLDRIDSRWYYAPQGGLVQWTPRRWQPIPAGVEGTRGEGTSPTDADAAMQPTAGKELGMEDRHIIEDFDPEGCRIRREMNKPLMDPARVREFATALARKDALLRKAMEALDDLKTAHWEHWPWKDIELADGAIEAIRAELKDTP